MTRNAITLVRLSIATMLGGAAFLWSGQLAARWAILAGFVC